MPGIEIVCKNCGKTFKDQRAQKRKFCSIRCSVQYNEKMGVIGRGRPRKRPPAENLKVTHSCAETHDGEILAHVDLLEREGFRCIPSGIEKFPTPDIIAIRNDKVYAVEIHRSKIAPSSSILGKYDTTEKCFDDIMWIWVKGEFSKPHSSKKRGISHT